jgi:putative DNA primase/helicase
MGAGKWLPDFGPHLAGRDVVVLPDDDEAGRPHGRDVAAKLAGHAARVRILQMPEPHNDVSDWIAAGGTAAQLLDMVEAAAVPGEAASAAPPEEVPEPQPDDLTEDGVALAFAAAHAGRVVFDHTERRWAEWDGLRRRARLCAAHPGKRRRGSPFTRPDGLRLGGGARRPGGSAHRRGA